MPDVAVRAESVDLVSQRAAISRALALLCDRYLDEVRGPVGDAIRYSLMGEGKRMRGILFLSAFHAADGAGDASPLAAAIEVVHAYSLVHDDFRAWTTTTFAAVVPRCIACTACRRPRRLVWRWCPWPRAALRMPRKRLGSLMRQSARSSRS
jgi:hypothetical protein